MADAERGIHGLAFKFYTEEGNRDLVGDNTPVFFLRDPFKFPDVNYPLDRRFWDYLPAKQGPADLIQSAFTSRYAIEKD